jgi:hypothetical protein
MRRGIAAPGLAGAEDGSGVIDHQSVGCAAAEIDAHGKRFRHDLATSAAKPGKWYRQISGSGVDKCGLGPYADVTVATTPEEYPRDALDRRMTGRAPAGSGVDAMSFVEAARERIDYVASTQQDAVAAAAELLLAAAWRRRRARVRLRSLAGARDGDRRLSRRAHPDEHDRLT